MSLARAASSTVKVARVSDSARWGGADALTCAASHLACIRQRLLANVRCGQCRHEVTITNFTGIIKSGNLLLVGKCAECHGDVARVIEGS